MSEGRGAPLATHAAIALEPAPFPHTTDTQPEETGFDDWRERLTRNLSRRCDGRWDPLTWIHPSGSTRAV